MVRAPPPGPRVRQWSDSHDHAPSHRAHPADPRSARRDGGPYGSCRHPRLCRSRTHRHQRPGSHRPSPDDHPLLGEAHCSRFGACRTERTDLRMAPGLCPTFVRPGGNRSLHRHGRADPGRGDGNGGSERRRHMEHDRLAHLPLGAMVRITRAGRPGRSPCRSHHLGHVTLVHGRLGIPPGPGRTRRTGRSLDPAGIPGSLSARPSRGPHRPQPTWPTGSTVRRAPVRAGTDVDLGIQWDPRLRLEGGVGLPGIGRLVASTRSAGSGASGRALAIVRRVSDRRRRRRSAVGGRRTGRCHRRGTCRARQGRRSRPQGRPQGRPGCRSTRRSGGSRSGPSQSGHQAAFGRLNT